jgi:hypothetical protein
MHDTALKFFLLDFLYFHNILKQFFATGHVGEAINITTILHLFLLGAA